ncbi:RNA RECOGNITION MOTIF XS DOMAIN PROTEIN [Salix koriyanagi]|uniref:RNA RECOGNITION MOTIF XS DOMAIN PROTEIN n=1 Tax=Salix koriyanagi TaxID=2511006 RepID=A0A9Q0WTU7_9ROSI|nr:RNA RECOGNITION MOTIF XS DOMAIN PROTEIN [Salix koriyanagi]
MAGGSHPKSTTHKPSSSSTPAPHRKSRWESTSSNNNNPPLPQSNQKLPKPNPSPKPNTGRSPKPATPTAGPIQPPQVPPFPFPDLGPPPPPTYGFHMLERRTIMLADGSARSYLALPPDYQDFPRPPLPPRFFHGGGTPDFLPGGPRFPPRSPDVLGFQNQNKRKFEEELVKHVNNSSNYNNSNSNGKNYTSWGAGTSNVGGEIRAGKQMRISDGVGFVSSNNIRNVGEVNQSALKKAFLHFVKVINENEADRKKYLEDRKQGRLQCVACGRSSKDFPDMHALIMHTYNSDNADVRVDHLGLHKALCVLMGWNYSKPPDNSKAYQFLPADEAGANQDDLIMWPPMVIIHNTITGKGKDGRLEGLGNRAMDSKVRDLGFVGGKSKSLYGRDGHLGITLVKFGGDQSGLKEAMRLAEHFEKDNRGHKAWGSHTAPDIWQG